MTLSRALALLCLAPVAVRLHEGAHVAAARIIGWRARAVYGGPITLDAWGARMEYDADAATWGEHAVVSLAGPAASLAWLVVVVLVATVVLQIRATGRSRRGRVQRQYHCTTNASALTGRGVRHLDDHARRR